LSASVGGTATGPITYTFWWNCTDPGTSVATVTTACGDPTNATIGAKFTAVTTNPQTAAHTYAAGTYTAKVIAERGTASPAEARASVTATAAGAALFADDFNRADSATPGPQWTAVGGSWAIQSNQLVVPFSPGGATVFLVTTTPLPQADYQVSSQVVPLTGRGVPVLVARFVDAGNHYLFGFGVDSQDVKLFRVTGGGYTQLGSSYRPPAGLSFGTTYALRLTVQGSTITGEFSPDGGTTWVQVASAADSTFPAAGRAGYRAWDSTWRADNFLVVGR
jgi:hypothetical protein